MENLGVLVFVIWKHRPLLVFVIMKTKAPSKTNPLNVYEVELRLFKDYYP